LAEETLSSRRIYQGRAVNLRVDTVRLPSGRQTTREVVEHEECVAVVAVDDKDNILLVKQYRQPVEKELLEIVAGGIDPGESPEDCVRREMREETGFLPQKPLSGHRPGQQPASGRGHRNYQPGSGAAKSGCRAYRFGDHR
jgi:ADP-ribose pyrophosphatase